MNLKEAGDALVEHAAVEWDVLPNRMFWIKELNPKANLVVLETAAHTIVASGVPVEECHRVFKKANDAPSGD